MKILCYNFLVNETLYTLGERMKIIKVQDEHEGGQVAYELLREALEKGGKALGLATGSTPISLYEKMINSDLDFSDIITINLDEYIGLDINNDQSYHYFMEEHLFKYCNFKESHVPDGRAEDLDQECKNYDELLEKHPIDFQILGIGPNGHIGFNEPGTPFDSKTHTTELTESTINANKRFFNSVEEVPTRAITMGIQSIMDAKEVVLIAYGEKKAQAMKNTIEGPISEAIPASILKKHPNSIIIIDEAAGSLLEEEK